jgi:phospholipase/carboxylesterase
MELSRRRVLLGAGAVVVPGLACTRRASAPGAGARTAAADGWGGLSVAIVGDKRGEARGGTAVVLLHGWGAPGDDLVGLAHMLDHPGARFFVPAAPLTERGGGRAWWHFDGGDRPEHATNDQAPVGEPHRDVKAARIAVQTMLRTIRQRYVPDRLCIGGFSQGAMVSLDIALDASPPVDRVAVLSGTMMLDSLPGLRAERAARPPVFMAHGRQDRVVYFAGGERTRDMLQRHGYQVSFHAFDGGHEIPAEIMGPLAEFFFA